MVRFHIVPCRYSIYVVFFTYCYLTVIFFVLSADRDFVDKDDKMKMNHEKRAVRKSHCDRKNRGEEK